MNSLNIGGGTMLRKRCAQSRSVIRPPGTACIWHVLVVDPSSFEDSLYGRYADLYKMENLDR